MNVSCKCRGTKKMEKAQLGDESHHALCVKNAFRNLMFQGFAWKVKILFVPGGKTRLKPTANRL